MNDVKFRFVNRINATGEIKFVYTSINDLEGEDSWQGRVNYSRLAINMCANLTDKNGKEIYEGDIFKVGAEKQIFEVRFESGCFMAFENDKQFGLIGELKDCFIDIIGNIYENR